MNNESTLRSIHAVRTQRLADADAQVARLTAELHEANVHRAHCLADLLAVEASITKASAQMPSDYYSRPIEVGDVLRSMACDPRGGLPLYACNVDLTVVALGRTRVEVTGPSFNGTLRPPADHLRITQRNGVAVPLEAAIATTEVA